MNTKQIYNKQHKYIYKNMQKYNDKCNDKSYSNSVKNMNNIICSNCGKLGHIFKVCQEPVISYGLICFYKSKNIVNNEKKTRKHECPSSSNILKIKLLKRQETFTHTLKNMLGITGIRKESNENIDTVVNEKIEEIIDMDNEYITENITQSTPEHTTSNNEIILNNQDKEKPMLDKVILVQRRHTIGFIELMRGKYDIEDYNYIVKLFNMMTFDEKRLFREYDNFDSIRTIIGLKNINNNEYNESKLKFTTLQNHKDGNMIFKLMDKSYTRWTTPEWGLPKGRRHIKEYDIECAIREFVEETGIKYKHLNVYKNIKPLIEIYKGINGITYKHIYYLASINNTDAARLNIENIEKGGQINYEISNIKLFNQSECKKILRPYYTSKLNAINEGFNIINSIYQYFE